MKPAFALRFLGVGNAQAVELGSASAVIERAGAPLLMIDCGQEALSAYCAQYQAWPDALFLTHAHFDHIARDLRGVARLAQHVIDHRRSRGGYDAHMTADWALLKADKEVRAHLSATEIAKNFDLRHHLKHVDTIFKRVFGRA